MDDEAPFLALRLQAHRYLCVQQWESATALFAWLLSTNPHDETLRASLAYALLESGHAVQAGDVLAPIERSMQPVVQFLRGRALAAAGNAAGAAAAFSRYARLRRRAALPASSPTTTKS